MVSLLIFFPCETGVRQGENLSPFLFALYLNDLEQFLHENLVNGLDTITNMCSENLDIFFKLFILLYADDTVILAESYEKLQDALCKFQDYCKHWKLTVNVSKTKIVIFFKTKTDSEFQL